MNCFTPKQFTEDFRCSITQCIFSKVCVNLCLFFSKNAVHCNLSPLNVPVHMYIRSDPGMFLYFFTFCIFHRFLFNIQTHRRKRQRNTINYLFFVKQKYRNKTMAVKKRIHHFGKETI